MPRKDKTDDDRITAARLKADGWSTSGDDIWFKSIGQTSDAFGQLVTTAFYVSEGPEDIFIRHVTGMADLRELCRVLNGEK